jgi:hypothetical protein
LIANNQAVEELLRQQSFAIIDAASLPSLDQVRMFQVSQYGLG